MSDNKDVRRGIVLYLDGKEVVNNITAIEAECRKLVKEQKSMTRGSKEYIEQGKKIRMLKGILAEHNQQLRAIRTEVDKSTFSLGKFVDGFNRFGGFVASSIAALTGFVLGLKALRDEQNKLEDSQSGLQALTGLDDDSISWLTDHAKELSTTMTEEGLRVRQSANEILDAFMLVGSAKPELLGNKKALADVTEEAMRLQAAAKDITLNQAVDALTLALNQYGDAADQAVRYTNVLAAGSKAGSANIASEAKAIRTAGTAAASAKVPIEQTVALIETLAYKGIKDEIAGTGLKKFFLVLQTGARETNPAIVGLDKALENLKNKKMDATAIKKMFGEEGYNSASVIIQNTDMVKQFTEAVTGTNIAYEQAAINSDTASAKLAQARNQMKLAGIELVEKLNPAIMISTNAMTYVVKILPRLIDWFKKWNTEMAVITLAILLYATRIKLITTYHTVLNTVIKAATIVQGAYRLSMIALNDALAGDVRALAAFTRQMASTNVVTKVIAASTMLYRAAVELLTFRFKGAAVALKGFFGVVKMGGFGLLLSVVTAASLAWLTLSKRMDTVTKAQRKLNDIKKEAISSVQTEIAEVKSLYNIATDTNASYTARKEAIEALNKLSPEYLGNLTLESINTSEAKKSMDGYIASMIRKATIQTELNRLGEINAKLAKYDNNAVNYLDKEINAWELLWNAATTGSAIPEWEELLEEKKMLEKSLQEAQEEDFNATKPQRTLEIVKKELEDAEQLLKKLNNTNTELFSGGELIAYNAQLKTVSASIVKLKSEKEQLEEEEKKKRGGGTGVESETEAQKRIKKELAEIETEYLQKQNELKKRYLQDEKMTQQAYANELEKLELEKLDKQLAIAGLEPDAREKINQKIVDISLTTKQKIERILESITKEGLTEYQKQKAELEKHENEELEVLQKALDQKLISVQKYEETLLAIKKKYAEKVKKIEEKRTDEESEAIQRRYQDRIQSVIDDANGDLKKLNFKSFFSKVSSSAIEMRQEIESTFSKDDPLFASLMQQITELDEFAVNEMEDLKNNIVDTLSSLGESFADFFTNEETDFGDFMGNVLTILLDSLEKQLIATQANAIATITMNDIMTKGFAGIATAAKIALITAAFETAKGLLNNFYTGGYTGGGDWDEPKGVVHSNEFVANRFAVANPAVRPVLDLIDVAQRTGSIDNLSSDDIAAVTGKSDFSPVTVVSSPVPVPDHGSDDEVKFLLIECSRLMKQMRERLKEPLIARTYANGKGGTMEAEELVNKMKRNAQRRR